MNLSTIHATLAQLGTEPTRSLGQNFLHDQNLAAWIVAQLDLQPGEPWVEFGPGLGALTEFALAKSSNGLVIEKDGRLADFLRAQFPALEVVHTDALDFDLRELFARGPVKLFGNLPYYVSSQILFNVTADPSPASAFIFTLQREVAERLSAKPSTKEYGALTLLIGRRWRAKYLRTLSPQVFTPAPTVESGIVAIVPREPDELPACDSAAFTRLVKRGFAQRRKQLRKNLGDEITDWSGLCAHLGVAETARAEELSLVQWIALTRWATGTSETTSSAAQNVHGEMFDIVDEQDAVIRQASRHEAHTQALRHRAVHIFVFNEHGELFLQRRSRWKDVHPLRWDSSAAGHVDAGRSYDETAPRELQEELGIAAPVREIGSLPARETTGWEFVRLYRAEHNGPFCLNPAEIETGGWFTLPQLARWTAARPDDFASGFLECFARLSDERAEGSL